MYKTNAPASRQVVVVGAWQAAGGVVTGKVGLVIRLNGAVSRGRTAALKGVVEQVQPMVRERRRT